MNKQLKTNEELEAIPGLKLNIGAGVFPLKTFINLDYDSKHHPDCLFDLTDLYKGKKLPFPDNNFDFINGDSIIEHFVNILPIIEELWRVAKPGAVIRLKTSHWSHYYSWGDITHYRTFSRMSFENFNDRYKTIARFSDIKIKYRNENEKFAWLNKIYNKFPRLTELFLCKILPLELIEIKLEVQK